MQTWSELCGDDSLSNLSMKSADFDALVIPDVSNSMSRSRFGIRDAELDNSRQGLNLQLRNACIINGDSNSVLSKKRTRTKRLETDEKPNPNEALPPKSKLRTKENPPNFSRFLKDPVTETTHDQPITQNNGPVRITADSENPWQNRNLNNNRVNFGQNSNELTNNFRPFASIVGSKNNNLRNFQNPKNSNTKMNRFTSFLNKENIECPHGLVSSASTSNTPAKITGTNGDVNNCDSDAFTILKSRKFSNRRGLRRRTFMTSRQAPLTEKNLNTMKNAQNVTIPIDKIVDFSVESERKSTSTITPKHVNDTAVNESKSECDQKTDIVVDVETLTDKKTESIITDIPTVDTPLDIEAIETEVISTEDIEMSEAQPAPTFVETVNGETTVGENKQEVQPVFVPQPMIPMGSPICIPTMNNMCSPLIFQQVLQSPTQPQNLQNGFLHNQQQPLVILVPNMNQGQQPMCGPYVIPMGSLILQSPKIVAPPNMTMAPEPTVQMSSQPTSIPPVIEVPTTTAPNVEGKSNVPSNSVWGSFEQESVENTAAEGQSWANKLFPNAVKRNKVLSDKQESVELNKKSVERMWQRREERLLPTPSPEPIISSAPIFSNNNNKSWSRKISSIRSSPSYRSVCNNDTEPEPSTEPSETSTRLGDVGEPLTEIKISKRQIQIQNGKNTVGYKTYVKLIPKHKRKKSHPQTPDPTEQISKRRFNGKVTKWRKKLHEFDTCSVMLNFDTALNNNQPICEEVKTGVTMDNLENVSLSITIENTPDVMCDNDVDMSDAC